MTLTRIAYQSLGKDKIIHNYETPLQYSLKEDIEKKDRFIQPEDSKALKAILGTGDIEDRSGHTEGI